MSNVSRNGNIFEDVAIKAAVRLASTSGNLVLSGEQAIDGVAAVDGDRVLLTSQTDATQNGIWQVATGVWQRTADARNNTDFIDGTLVPVARGASNAGLLYQLRCTDSPVAIDGSDLVFELLADIASTQQAGSSATSTAIGTGAKSFASQVGKAWETGQWLLIYQTSDPGNAMLAQIDSYAAGALGVTVVSTAGSGTHGDWSIVLVNSPASAGRVPPVGTGNVTGPGLSVAGHLPRFADSTGKVLEDSGKTAGTLAGRDVLLYGDAGTASIPASALAPGAAPLPYCGTQPNDNLHLVNDVINPTRDFNITAGRCRDDSDEVNLYLAGTMVKRLDQAWAAGGVAGAPAGACDAGTKGASQTWHIYLMTTYNLAITSVSRTSNVATISCAAHGLGVGGTVRNYGIGSGFDAIAVITAVTADSYSYANTGPDLGATSVAAFANGYDILASQSYPGPTRPAGWNTKQCLGSFMTNGSGNIIAMFHYGDEFWFKAPALNASISVPYDALLGMTAPLGVKVKSLFNVAAVLSNTVNSTVSAYFMPPDITDNSTSIPAGLVQLYQLNSVGGTSTGIAAQMAIWTDTSAQIRVNATGAASIYFTSVGWCDPRRRMF